MRIKFLKDAHYKQNGPDDKFYKAGHEYTVTDDHGQRWIRRGAAVEVEVPKVVAKPEPKKPEPPKADK